MAYAGASAAILSNYSEVLKTFYLPAIQEQINHDTILMDKIALGPQEDVAGKNFTINMHYGRSGGIGARADGGALPEADYQKYKTATVPMRYNYGRVTFSGPTIAATRSERGSYADVIDSEITGIVRDMKKDINRQLWGCGYGILSRWQSGTSTTIVLEKAYRGNTNGDGFGCTFGGKYLKEQPHAVLAQLTTKSGSTCTVFTVTSDDIASITTFTKGTTSDTIVVGTDPGTPAAGTYFCRPGAVRSIASASVAAGYARLEMVGLRGLVTNQDLDEIAMFDGTNTGYTTNDPLQGLAVGTYDWWKAIVDSSSTRYGAQRALTLKMMDKMFDDVEENAGKDYGPDMILTTRAIRREYTELCRADRRVVNTMTLDGGWSAIDYNGIPFTVDNDAIDGEIYFLTLKDIARYRMSDFEWMEKDGSVFSRLTGYDAYEATLFAYMELGCRRRNSQGVLCDLSYEI